MPDISQDKINSYWDSRARAYHHYQTQSARAVEEQRLWQNVLSTTLQPELLVADMGTGSGYLATTLAHLDHQVIGVDASVNMLRHMPKHPKISAVAGDVHQPPLPKQMFSAITSRYLLWTLHDPVTALKNWRELLKTTGTIIAFDALWFPNGDGIAPQVESTTGADAFIHTYTRETLEALPLALTSQVTDYLCVFEAAGFQDIGLRWLPENTDLDVKYGVSPGHVIRPQFMITAKP